MYNSNNINTDNTLENGARDIRYFLGFVRVGVLARAIAYTIILFFFGVCACDLSLFGWVSAAAAAAGCRAPEASVGRRFGF